MIAGTAVEVEATVEEGAAAGAPRGLAAAPEAEATVEEGAAAGLPLAAARGVPRWRGRGTRVVLRAASRIEALVVAAVPPLQPHQRRRKVGVVGVVRVEGLVMPAIVRMITPKAR